jgi:hypothetical protein
VDISHLKIIREGKKITVEGLKGAIVNIKVIHWPSKTDPLALV